MFGAVIRNCRRGILLPFPLARIDVGHVIGKEPWKHTIWVEREYLELEDH
jgi:hypothetical protein